MITEQIRFDQQTMNSGERAQITLGLVYTMGFPVQLACWIMSGMKKQTYIDLKKYIEESYGLIPGTADNRGVAHAKKMDDTRVNSIIRQLKITGYWRDMPKAEYRAMLLSVQNRQRAL